MKAKQGSPEVRAKKARKIRAGRQRQANSEAIAILRHGAEPLPVDCFMVRALYGAHGRHSDLFADVVETIDDLHELLADLAADNDIVYRDIEVFDHTGEPIVVPAIPIILPQRSAVA